MPWAPAARWEITPPEFTILKQHFRTDLRKDEPVVYKDSVGVSGYRMDIHEKGRGNQSRTERKPSGQ